MMFERGRLRTVEKDVEKVEMVEKVDQRVEKVEKG